MKLFLILLFTTISTHSYSQKPIEKDRKNKSIMAIFAHPDDELQVASVLAKYASEGVTVYLVVAADGRLGLTEHAGIPAGDSLASVREQETICSANALGLQPPIMLGFPDQFDLKDGFDAVTKHMNSLRHTLYELVLQIKPDVVITWGPSGWTGHLDHRLVSMTVTEIFAYQIYDWPIQLFYTELPTGSVPDTARNQYFTVDTSYLPVRVPVSQTDFDKTKLAWQCHKSQYSAEAMTRISKFQWDIQKSLAYFRPFSPLKKSQQSLFID